MIIVEDAGLGRLSAEIKAASVGVAARASQVVRKTAYDIQADAQALAPVDTGFLRGSISVSLGKLSAVIGPTADYGIYQELGTSRMAAQPYLAPAFDRRLPGFERAMGQLGGTIL